MPNSRKAFTTEEVVLVALFLFVVLFAYLAFIKPTKQISQETEQVIQERMPAAKKKVAEQTIEELKIQALKQQQIEEENRNNLINQEKQQQLEIQKEYQKDIQPFPFTINNWQYNREQEISVFILYDINNKIEYIVVKTGVGSPNPAISITPRIKAQ